MQDLTLTEARDAFKAFTASVGPKARCSAELCVSMGDATVYAFFQPRDSVGGGNFLIYADTWRDLLTKCEEKWAEFSERHAANLIREMALAIIDITADHGECSDAALRAKFDAADVMRFGERACEQATEMASNGPFSIVSLSGANDIGEAA